MLIFCFNAFALFRKLWPSELWTRNPNRKFNLKWKMHWKDIVNVLCVCVCFFFHFTFQCSMRAVENLFHSSPIRLQSNRWNCDCEWKKQECEMRQEGEHKTKLRKKKTNLFIETSIYVRSSAAGRLTIHLNGSLQRVLWKFQSENFDDFPFIRFFVVICGFNHFVHLKRNQTCLLIVGMVVRSEYTRKPTNKWIQNIHTHKILLEIMKCASIILHVG